jgi:hypothetical protein
VPGVGRHEHRRRTPCPRPPPPCGTRSSSRLRPAAAPSPSISTTSSRPTPPQRPGAYLRISSDRFGLEAGVDRQLQDAEDTRLRLGWGEIAKIYKENDTSAFKKRKVTKSDGSVEWMVVRPVFRRLPADLAAGVIDGVVFYDLERLVRQPRDLEDLIDIVEYV